jgi:hypothetical protein
MAGRVVYGLFGVSDPLINERTWQTVIEEIIKLKKAENQLQWARAAQDHAFDIIRSVLVLDTRSGHFLRVLEAGTVSTNVFRH